MNVTKEQVAAAVRTIAAFGETIRELGEVPSGVLYAIAMGKGIDLAAYERIIDRLVGAELVERRGDVLVWIGPQPAAETLSR